LHFATSDKNTVAHSGTGFSASGAVYVNAEGEARAKGSVTVWGDAQSIVLSDSDTTVRCSDGEFLEIAVTLHSRSGGQGELIIAMRSPGSAEFWKPAEFSITGNGQEPLEMDGAILVVSAAEGPMP
jgi:hypothetical protein